MRAGDLHFYGGLGAELQPGRRNHTKALAFYRRAAKLEREAVGESVRQAQAQAGKQSGSRGAARQIACTGWYSLLHPQYRFALTRWCVDLHT
jgi:hypothetical protein